MSAACVVAAASGILGAGFAAYAVAQPAPTAPVPEPLCVPVDRELEELSGLAMVGDAVYAVPDGGSSVAVAEMANVLAGDCSVTRWIRNELNPYDPEDLTARGDTLWVADIGDNNAQRDTVALIRVDPDSGAAQLHRMHYPDRARDAETILLDRRGMPIIVSKGIGVGEVFVPEGGHMTVDELPSPGPIPLEQVATLTFQMTDTPGGPIGAFSSVLPTGGAVNDAGTIAAVRTYTDVHLYADASGDLVTALQRAPIIIPLPGEPQGEAIAFTATGDLLSGSELGFPITGDPNRPPEDTSPLPPIQILRGVEDYVWSVQAQDEPDVLPSEPDNNAASGDSKAADHNATSDGPLAVVRDRAIALGVGVGVAVLIGGATAVLWRRRG
ncbi:hypothetical protein ONR57_08465 [Hoyosella sp. YIM 151337]|uniref:hypothetical protein n=1 Tax=Hoyosella sp. YIM 151337 TaxID=2992742 RepID=UPI00223552E7|nr:hypothetical protein [Hoyosella sp. YIM 151337]MCW4353328.1 hypothetical protein [Hoyosella sp. YIM 151337]